MVTAIVTVACGALPAMDKAGGRADPVTLRMGTRDGPGAPGGRAVREFSRLVDHLSSGTLRIEPVWNAHGTAVRGWDALIVRRVAEGDLDLALVATTAWEPDVAPGLGALQAPFLVDSDRLLEELATPEVASGLLRDLDAAGMRGLALLPKGLRHPFSFGRPLRAPADYVRRTIQIPEAASVVADTLHALRARPGALGPAELRQAAEAGTIAGAAASLRQASELPLGATATGNVVLYAEMEVIALSHDVLDELDEELVDVLTKAALQTSTWVLTEIVPLAEAAASFCAGGGAIVVASDADLAALAEAVGPVYESLLGDRRTADAIARIQALRRQLPPPPPIEPCGPP
jgi:TRAP-type C4-dicarboxylate transport system substrate-binding protein